ncbi:MAG: YtxH domain-containing protein [Chitinophagaceae bacterium]|nr:YtxH domain-containing protein [Chitinophagaceae bacterium]MCB9047583.1 YtxH domain-containing protein [Chitinophagales bacterium]
MANTGRTVATLLIGAAVGAAVGYIIATDDKKRKEDFDKLKNQVNDWTEKLKHKADDFKKKTEDLEADIFHG